MLPRKDFSRLSIYYSHMEVYDEQYYETLHSSLVYCCRSPLNAFIAISVQLIRSYQTMIAILPLNWQEKRVMWMLYVP
jgi:hypothetical protein